MSYILKMPGTCLPGEGTTYELPPSSLHPSSAPVTSGGTCPALLTEAGWEAPIMAFTEAASAVGPSWTHSGASRSSSSRTSRRRRSHAPTAC
ncbi:PDE2A isoform 8, partial [Pongo abelii]